MQKFLIVGLGELLWDVFPTHKQLGGAPANFAYISSVLGDEAIVASRVGHDAAGEEARSRIADLGLSLGGLQMDEQHPTGTVQVEVVSDGQPRFEIKEPVAWDFLNWTPELQQLATRADAVCFGSLAQRRPTSRATIQQFLRATREQVTRIFDVNLRQSYFSEEVLRSSVEAADILKLNHEELPTVLEALKGPVSNDLFSARWLCDRFGLRLVCVTRGSAGSLLVTPSAFDEHAGFAVQVADTVGAGDAFTAAMTHHFLRGSNLATMNAAANHMGACVASKHGATPMLTSEELACVRSAVS